MLFNNVVETHCSRIGRGGGGGGLKHMLTVHPLMFKVGVVCGGLGDAVISCCF